MTRWTRRNSRSCNEKNLKALPTFACMLGYPAFWIRDLDTGVDWVNVVHGEQGIVLHRPLAPRGRVVGVSRIVDVVDKGPGRGAAIYSERRIIDQASGETIATLTQTTFCRGDGGFGGPRRPAPAPHVLPDRAPDLVCDLPTRPEAALIYRLSATSTRCMPSLPMRGPRVFLARSCTDSRPSRSRAMPCSRRFAVMIRRG